VEKLVKRFLEAEAVREAMEPAPVKPYKNGGNGGDIGEDLTVFHVLTMRDGE
jgi:hypothetical protein